MPQARARDIWTGRGLGGGERGKTETRRRLGRSVVYSSTLDVSVWVWSVWNIVVYKLIVRRLGRVVRTRAGTVPTTARMGAGCTVSEGLCMIAFWL
jgi:hypothetical protein